MSSWNRNIVYLNISFSSSSNNNLSSTIKMNNKYWFALRFWPFLFRVWFKNQIIWTWHWIVKYTDCLSFKCDCMGVKFLANFTLDCIPSILHRSIRNLLFFLFCRHPFLKTTHVEQTLCAFALTWINQGIIVWHHFI